MAVDNTAIGSALIIPDSLLKNMGEVDKKIKDIQDTSKQTAQVFNTQFASMSLNTGNLLNNLQQVINQLGSVGQAAQTASSATQNMGSGLGTAAQGATNLGTSVTGVVEAINRMIGQLQQTGQVGSSSLMAAKLAADKLMEAMQFKNTGNIAAIKDEIQNINKTLKDTESALSRSEQQTLVERKRLLQEELKEAERTQNERAVNLQRVLDRMMRAEQSYQRQVEQARKKTAQDYQKQNYASNTTYSGSLSFADNANTINRRTQAIKYLTEARNALSKTDADYTNKLATLNAKIKELNSENRQAIASSQELNNSHRRLMDAAGQLQRAFALAFSASQIKGYIEAIAQTRGYFELQHKSLQSILQDGTKATEIYKKTINLALDSPFRAKELISFTKQLAAYRIENDKLYDTTKRLADVSAGLGVSMDRLALAYGQVKAAAYLRGSEVRQFTEAGVNMYGELQSYFKEVKGEAYTTAQIVDMISRRKVTFEDVEQIFKRMTNQGGLFYNMQHIQVETLSGKIGKFKDAVDQMMNSIGKSNEGLYKGGLDAATYLVQNYEGLAVAVKSLVGAFVGMKGFPVIAKGVSAGWLAIRNQITGTSASFVMASASSNKLTASLITMKNVGVVSVKALRTAIWSLKSALGGIALMFAIDALITYWQKTKELEKATANANSEFAKQKAKVSDLSYEFERFGKAKATALSQRNDKDYNASVDSMKKKLQELIDYGNKLGMNIKINVQGLKPDDLKAQFDNVKKQIDDYVTYLNVVKTRIAESDNSFLSDGVTKNAEDYDKAANSFIASSYKIDDAINIAKQHYSEATAETQQYFDTLRKGRIEGESDLDYYKRMYKALESLRPVYFSKAWNTDMAKMFSDTEEKFNALISSSNDLKASLIEVLGFPEEVRKKWGNDPVKIKAAIDKMELSEEARKAAYIFANSLYGIKIPVQRPKDDELVREARDIHWVLQNYFDTHKIKLKADASGLDPKKALGEIQEFGESYEYWVKLEKQIKKSAIDTAYTLKGIGLEGTFSGKSLGLNAKLVDANTKISKNDLLTVIRLQKEAAKARADAWGVDPFEKKNARDAAKAQRDILSEQIEAYKDLQSQYEKYLKIYDKETAKAKALESLRYKLQNAGIYDDAAGIVPDEKTIAGRIKNIASKFKEIQKRGDAYKIVADLEYQTDDKSLKSNLDKVKTEVEKAFNGLQLYKNLKDLGLSDVEVSKMFGNITKSFADVRKEIENSFASKFGADQTKWSDEIAKDYAEQMNELDKQIYENSVSQFKELSKAYKDELDERLKIDLWYAEERKKIEENEQLAKNPALKDEYLRNLEKQRAQKSDEADWKQFQNSDSYIRIFENLETTSSRVLTAMQEKLASLRGSLKNLSPEQLKQIVEQQEKIDNLLAQKNPFDGLVLGIKDYIKFAKQRKQLETEYLQSIKKEDDLQSQKDTQTQAVENAKQRYELAVKIFGMYSPEAAAAERLLKVEQDKLKVILDEAVAQGKITEELRDQILAGEKAQKKISGNISSIANGYREISGAVGEFTDMLSNFGVNIPEELAGVLSGIGQTIDGLESIDLTKPMSIITGSVKTLAGIGNTIGSIFGFGNKDKKLQKEIEKQEKIVTRLQRAYDDLKTSMDNAWSATSVIQANENTKANIEQQIDAYEKMIKAEEDKKKTDHGKIEEWENQIKELKKTLKELEEQTIETFGGFGSEANYKSAAQEFADAWVDAFNETENTLKALNDTFDNYFNNMLKKQLMQRAAQKYLQPIFDAFDKAVSEGSEGGNQGRNVTKEEIAEIQRLKDAQLKSFDEYAKALMEVLGVKPSGDKDLSKLQQGIQNITESTGQALESLLNSIRFFVAQQTADVSAIRALLQLSSNIDITTSADTPMLTELKAQTGYLRDIRNALNGVIRQGHPMGGAGIKVLYG